MSYQTPKTDWNEAYTPTPSDMNRIEGNTQDNRAEILLEESARIAADTILNNSISGEISARIDADDTKLNKATMGNRNRVTFNLSGLQSQIIPAGTHYVANTSGSELQIRDSGGTWRGMPFGLIISDGNNARVINQNTSGTQSYSYITIA